MSANYTQQNADIAPDVEEAVKQLYSPKAMLSQFQHTFNGRPCSFVGREFTSACPYVVVRFSDGTEQRVKGWELEPKVPIYAK